MLQCRTGAADSLPPSRRGAGASGSNVRDHEEHPSRHPSFSAWAVTSQTMVAEQTGDEDSVARQDATPLASISNRRRCRPGDCPHECHNVFRPERYCRLNAGAPSLLRRCDVGERLPEARSRATTASTTSSYDIPIIRSSPPISGHIRRTASSIQAPYVFRTARRSFLSAWKTARAPRTLRPPGAPTARQIGGSTRRRQ